MTLITPELSVSFRSALRMRSKSLQPIKSVGMVGASVDSWKLPNERTPSDYVLEPFEEDFLLATNRLVQPYGYEVGVNVKVHVSELKRKSDFLTGAFNGLDIHLLVLSSLYFNPDRDHTLGANTLQSPLASDPRNWINAFETISPVIILNIWKNGDQESGHNISEMIDRVEGYKSIYFCHSGLVSWDDCRSGYSVDNGGDLFLRM